METKIVDNESFQPSHCESLTVRAEAVETHNIHHESTSVVPNNNCFNINVMFHQLNGTLPGYAFLSSIVNHKTYLQTRIMKERQLKDIHLKYYDNNPLYGYW